MEQSRKHGELEVEVELHLSWKVQCSGVCVALDFDVPCCREKKYYIHI